MQCTYRCKAQACSCNHCTRSRGKTSITFSECVSVALGTQREISMRHVFICGLTGTTIFFLHYLINGKIFEIRKLLYSTETFLILRKKNSATFRHECANVFV